MRKHWPSTANHLLARLCVCGKIDKGAVTSGWQALIDAPTLLVIHSRRQPVSEPPRVYTAWFKRHLEGRHFNCVLFIFPSEVGVGHVSCFVVSGAESPHALRSGADGLQLKQRKLSGDDDTHHAKVVFDTL